MFRPVRFAEDWTDPMTADRWRTLVAIPDAHIPDHHVRALQAITSFIGEFQPDDVLQLGDFIDCAAPARWNKGRALEFADTLQAECDKGFEVFRQIREVFDGRFRYIEGNHEERIRNYAESYAPALASLRGLRLPELLRLDELEVALCPQPLRVAPGWSAIHGDRLATYAGGSALKMVKLLGTSVIQGHSHRAGIIHDTTDRTRTAMECGHVSNQRRASYIPYGRYANWQLSFGILNIRGDKVVPELVPIAANGSFRYQGVDYGAAKVPA